MTHAAQKTSTRHDVIVVGGRIAGALTAAHLSGRGMSVLVLESTRFPSATLSTHFFRGDGLVRSLDQLGLLEEVLSTGPPRLVREYFYVGGSEAAEENPPQEPGDAGFCLSVRRHTLDDMIARHVARLPGVDFRTGVKTTEVLTCEGVVTGVRDDRGEEHLAPVTVGADGRRSSVARAVAAADDVRHPAARVMFYQYLTGWTGPGGGSVDAPEFSLSGNEMVYVFPSDGGTACVALTIPLSEHDQARADPDSYFGSRLRQHRGLWPRFAAGAPAGRLFSSPPEDSVVRQAAGPGWALVGDAGTHQDPWTGLGMDTAARQARAFAEAVTTDAADWNAAYAAARDSVTLERFTSTVTAAPDLRVLLG